MTGIIGIGGMGGGMLATLLSEGLEVCVSDINPEQLRKAGAQGAVVAESAAELVKTCDPVLLSLPSSKVAEMVLHETVIPHARKGQIIIDMGTTIIRVTREIHAALKIMGAGFVDAPVSGGTAGSETGNLFIFAGGDKEDVDKYWSILQKLGKQRLTYCGPSGVGQIAKAVNQLAMGLTSAAYLEAIAFGVNAGVDAAVLDQAVGGDGGFREALRQTARRVQEGKGDEFDIKYAEFAYFLDASREMGFDSPILEALYERLSGRPAVCRDNMNRPYPPFWSSLADGTKPE